MMIINSGLGIKGHHPRLEHEGKELFCLWKCYYLNNKVKLKSTEYHIYDIFEFLTNKQSLYEKEILFNDLLDYIRDNMGDIDI